MKPKCQKYKMFIFSKDVDVLIKFYTEALGLEVVGELKLPLDYGYVVRVADGYDLWIANHSKVKGKNKDKYRCLLNLYINGIKNLFETIAKYPGVEVIQRPVRMSEFNPEEKERWVCTITDPEGNMIQLMGAP